MKTSKFGLSAAQKASARKLICDPVLFAHHILGVSLWERQIEILALHPHLSANRYQGVPRSGQDFYASACGIVVARALREGHRLDHLAHLSPGPNPTLVRDSSLGGCGQVSLKELNATELKVRGDDN